MNYSLYLVTDPEMTAGAGLTTVVAAAVRGGVTVVQLRDKQADSATLARQVAQLRAAGVQVPIIVNDSVESARTADGVHLGQSDGDPVAARSALGSNAVIGLSVSTLEQVRAALALPEGTLDYLGVGPAWATDTKTDAATPLGPEGMADLVAAAGSLPCVAIGGIHPGERIRSLRGIGLAGVCVVSAICAAADPEAAARTLRREWDS